MVFTCLPVGACGYKLTLVEQPSAQATTLALATTRCSAPIRKRARLADSWLVQRPVKLPAPCSLLMKERCLLVFNIRVRRQRASTMRLFPSAIAPGRMDQAVAGLGRLAS